MQPPVPPDPSAVGPSASGNGLPPAPPPGGSPALPSPVIPPPGDQSGIGAPPQPQAPPPPVIDESSKIAKRLPSDQIKNPFERVATMVVEAADDHAARLARSLSEQPADTVEPDRQTVNEMMQFSPYGTDAPMQFWKLHDQILQEAVNSNDPDPYAAAERGALDAVYPYRAKLALLDVLGPEEKVQRADDLMRVVHQQISKGHTPESMPFLVGPQALSREDASMPAGSQQSGTNGGPV